MERERTEDRGNKEQGEEQEAIGTRVRTQPIKETRLHLFRDGVVGCITRRGNFW